MQDPVLPLELLRVFEASARLLSFTSAGRELGLSQPAVSQQIQRLERLLSVRLFERRHRALALSAAGALFLDHVQQALDCVHAGCLAIRAPAAREVLTVTTDFAFAACWLMPRLARFYQLQPQMDVSLITSNRGLLDARADVDLAIVCGDPRRLGPDARLLVPEAVFPVCSARWPAERVPRDWAEAARAPLLSLKPDPGRRWFDWPSALQAAGEVLAPSAVVREFDNYPLVLDAAVAGQGVALGWSGLVDDAIARGALRRCGGEPVRSERGYHLVQPQRKRRLRIVGPFVEWLEAELAMGAMDAGAIRAS